MQRQVEDAFSLHYGQSPRWTVRAPGRVNLIGEHTDYNDGFVLPMAIDRSIWMSLSPLRSNRVRLFSLDFDQGAQLNLTDLKANDQGWFEYVKGMAWAIQEEGFSLNGWEGVVAGDIPIGAGLSSSAAMELASARAFTLAAGLEWDPLQMAKLGQKAENQWIGVQCGIMDQLISAAGKANHALLIDCRSLETRAVPLPPGIQVIVMDTDTRRGLVDSAYNERRQQCEHAARLLNIPALRDISEREFHNKAGKLDDIVQKRASHVITENGRVLKAVTAMEVGDASEFGELMNQSHDSLRDDFQVSSPALDAIVSIAQVQAGCFGARMTGAGFGGCGVAIVDSTNVDDFLGEVGRRYLQITGLHSKLYICKAVDGVKARTSTSSGIQ